MRITSQAMITDFLSNLNNNQQNLQKYQNELSSGLQINKPSDDPFKVARSMQLNESIAQNNRYETDIEDGQSWLNTTSSALGQITSSLQRIRDLTVQAGDGSNDATDMQSIKDEIEQLKENIAQIGNTTYDNRYIFGGDDTINPPFNVTKTATGSQVVYNGSDNGMKREFAQGVTMDIAVTGNSFSNDPQTQPGQEGGIFQVITEITDDLNNNTSPTSHLTDLDTQLNNMLNLSAAVGAKVNRLDSMKTQNQQETLNMTTMLSNNQDIDVAKTAIEFQQAQNVYNASLETAAKILPHSLLDYLS